MDCLREEVAWLCRNLKPVLTCPHEDLSFFKDGHPVWNNVEETIANVGERLGKGFGIWVENLKLHSVSSFLCDWGSALKKEGRVVEFCNLV